MPICVKLARTKKIVFRFAGASVYFGGTSQMKGRKYVKTVGWKHIQNETTKIS